jgi:predicted 3-demethylubiquinone-9 3-methyltransferase (glyoxalase superfamily)
MSATVNPCLWFDGQAQEAAGFYASVFPDAVIVGDAGIMVTLRVADLELSLLNGGPEFKINPAMSFFYSCASAAEVDRLWALLAPGGAEMIPLGTYPFARRYGWTADKFGVNWQLILHDQEPKQRAYPSLMFTGANCGRAEEAMSFYASVFEDAAIGDISRYGPGMEPDREGAVNYSQFRLGGRWLAAMDSARPHDFAFSEADSLIVTCDDQAQIDRFWARLSAGGSESQCGWLKDKFGLSWQVVPRVLGELMSDPERARRVMPALLKMGKLDIATLEAQ